MTLPESTATSDRWEPANDVERTLQHAWEHNDTVLFVRTLAAAPFYLPGFTDRESAQRLLTWVHDDHTYLLVFTSPQALFQRFDTIVDGWRLTSITELIAARPTPDWGIAISPNTPIGAYLDPDDLESMADLLAEEPVFHPGSAAEAVMFQARREATPGAYLDALVLSSVLVPLSAPAEPHEVSRPDFPWRIETADGIPTVTAFTSELRLAEAVSDQVPTVRVETMALAHAWPDPSWQLAVNPGSAVDATFTGAQVADLITWARMLVAREQGTPSAQPVPTVEVVIDSTELDRYLTGAYDRAHGAVHEPGASPPGCYVVRWQPADGPIGSTVDGAVLPSGARILRIDPDSARVVATYQGELGRWLPAVADLLRGSALS